MTNILLFYLIVVNLILFYMLIIYDARIKE